MSKSVVFVTGTRADFGKIKPLAIALTKVGFDVTFFVTGMHMMSKYGLTKVEVEKTPDIKIVEHLNQREHDAQDITLAKTVTAFSDFIQENNPDLVVIHGDRIEALGSAIVCATNNRLSAHIEGGEISGTVDDIFRHSITKLCSHHFVSSQAAKNRIMRLGEHPSRIHIIGSPELDFHKQENNLSIEEVKSYYSIPFDEYGICIFHPVTTEIDTIKAQAEALFASLSKSAKNFVVIMPNNDPGGHHIEETLSGLPKSQFQILPSMRFEYFSKLAKESNLVVGNSSMGVREAPFMGIASINIGTRQTARSNATSISHLSAFDTEIVLHKIDTLWGTRHEKSEEFGKGNAQQIFLDTLLQDAFWNMPIQKTFYKADDDD